MLLKKQKGICPICTNKITRPVLDHQHKKRIHGTGQIRGVICSSCNVFLAKAENNSVRYGITTVNLPKILRNLADYLEKPHLPYMHPSEKEKPSIITKNSYKKLHKLFINHYSEKEWHKFPAYPKTGKMTVGLKKLYDIFKLEPEYYSK